MILPDRHTQGTVSRGGGEGFKNNSEGRQMYWDEEETDADEITFSFVDPFSVAQL